LDEPEQYTEDQVREKFIENVWMLIDWWDKETRVENPRGKLEGLAHSFLVMLDGGGSLPKFIVSPDPHPDDKEFHKKEGESWYPQNHKASISCDISGCLHEMLYRKEKSTD
jgi:hypothetical protein